MASKKRLHPTGECWCGCGNETGIGSVFKHGHDKLSESAVILTQFGSIAEFLDHFGIGPDGKNPSEEREAWRQSVGQIR